MARDRAVSSGGALLVALALVAHLAFDVAPAPPVAPTRGDHGRGQLSGAGPFTDRAGGDTEAFGHLTGSQQRVVISHLGDAKGAIHPIRPTESYGAKNTIRSISAIRAIESIDCDDQPVTNPEGPRDEQHAGTGEPSPSGQPRYLLTATDLTITPDPSTNDRI